MIIFHFHRIAQYKIIFLFFILFFSLFGNPTLASIGNLSPLNKNELQLAKKAINLAQNGFFDKAKIYANKAKNPLIYKMILWYQYQAGYKENDFADIHRFVKNNPNWPKIGTIEILGEYLLAQYTDNEIILDYFKDDYPATSYGKLLLAKAQAKSKKQIYPTKKLLLEAWRESNFTKDKEKEFIKEYGNILTYQDYLKRAERLIWDDYTANAQRLFYKLKTRDRLIFEAAIKLKHNSPGIDKSLAALTKEEAAHPLVIFERSKWHFKRKNYSKVAEYLTKVKTINSNNDKWWPMHNYLIREFLEKKQYSQAYELANYTSSDVGSSEYAEKKWLAGWIKLRFLKQPDKAYEHFYEMFNNVTFPISRARAAYWAARCAEANNNNFIAQNWYKIASNYPSTFYGQLAFEKINNIEPNIRAFPSFTKADFNKAAKNELIIAAKILIDIDSVNAASLFMKAAIDSTDDIKQKALITQLALDADNANLALITAKHAEQRENLILSKTLYPVIKALPLSNVGDALIHAIIRQESRFDPMAQSPANAIGYMQILPTTARRNAEDLKIKYTFARLKHDTKFNIIIGSYYIDKLYRITDESLIISIAAYNAGLSNVRKWQNRFYDPLDTNDLYKIIDWMELIPFKETRNYVQRVLENKAAYSYIYENKPFNLSKDLTSHSKK